MFINNILVLFSSAGWLNVVGFFSLCSSNFVSMRLVTWLMDLYSLIEVLIQVKTNLSRVDK